MRCRWLVGGLVRSGLVIVGRPVLGVGLIWHSSAKFGVVGLVVRLLTALVRVRGIAVAVSSRQ